MPTTAIAALQLIGDERSSVRELQYVIAKDQALTARILRIVNSAMYCLRREVATLSHAIAILGLETLRSIIIAASMKQAFHTGGGRGNDLTSQLLWEHSWGAAGAAKALAIATGYQNPEEAFTSGLLHDIGKLVLLKNRPERYNTIISEVYAGNTTFHEAERQTFGYSHVQVGALLAEKWHFPPQLVEVILHHHDASPPPEVTQLTALVTLANLMMILLEVGFEKDNTLKLEEKWPAQRLGLSVERLQKMTSEIQTMISVFTGAGQDTRSR